MNQNTNENEQNEKLRHKSERKFRSVNNTSIRTFFITLFLIFLIALMPFFRTSHSDVEHRTSQQMQKFPKLTFSTLASGEFFEGLNLWFTDTFPARDPLIRLNKLFRKSAVKSKAKVYGTDKEIEQADEIPDDVERFDEKKAEEVLEPEPFNNNDPANVETVGVLLVVDDTAYELYNFGLECADRYVYSVSRLAEKLDGKAKVYNLVVPTSIGVQVSQDLLDKYNVNSSDQHKAIDYIYGAMSSKVTTVNAYDRLEAHRSEYIYFRTDHHWTALGAYYAYMDLIKATGRTPFELSHYTEEKYDNFLGTFYSGSGMDEQLAKNPDTVYAYKPQDVETFKSTYYEGGKVYNTDSSPIIQNAENMSANNKYLAFMGGDRVLDIIENPKITDGSTCTVVKESYSNCLIPFLVDHYQTIYVVDPREYTKVYDKKLVDLILENGSREVFVINNVSATRQKGFTNILLDFIE